ncbi:hypothetical protein H8E77_26330 [bacterium]|nr:hypothetical protein [bacterium]
MHYSQSNEQQSLFLETTIQIERVVGHKERKEAIKNRIARGCLKTSTLVLREFKERLLHKCILLLELVLRYEHRADVETAISQMFSDTKILLQLWAQIQRETIGDGAYDRELVIETLKSYIEGGLEKRFYLPPVEVSNDTYCEIAGEKVRIEHGFYVLNVFCNRKKVNCNLPTFIEKHENAFEAMQKRIPNAKTKDERDELSKIVAVYQDAKSRNDFNRVKGQRHCNTLSDVTIALEAGDAIIYTTNRDFEYICPVCSRRFIRETTKG